MPDLRARGHEQGCLEPGVVEHRNVTVVGTGYLGATHAVCMAILCFNVVGVDVERPKIGSLSAAKLPLEVNAIGQRRRQRIVDLIRGLAQGKHAGAKISVLGAFKPDYDDLRDTPALDVARMLYESGAHVSVFDPQAMANPKAEYPELSQAGRLEAAVAGAESSQCSPRGTSSSLPTPSRWAACRATSWMADMRSMLTPTEPQDGNTGALERPLDAAQAHTQDIDDLAEPIELINAV